MCSRSALSWIEILTVRGIGAAGWSKLAEAMTAGEISEKLSTARGREMLFRLTGRRPGPVDPCERDRILGLIEKGICCAVSIEDAEYPLLLREIQDPPPLLYYRGDIGAAGRHAVCVVGSRRASRRGLVTAGRLSSGLAAAGFTVVSGMARGIDSAAHIGALEAGGTTVAVTGCGIDVAYPPENAVLAVEIASSGCVLTEFPPGSPPLRHNFPRRNRILSGISTGVVVVEAADGSGAMGTACWAADQGREVFAVPGPVEHSGSRGPHRLIREGAWLVEDHRDVIEVLDPGRGASAAPPADTGPAPQALSRDERAVFEALGIEPKHVDEIVHICHISATSTLPLLLGLELRGIARSCGSGRWAVAAEYEVSRRESDDGPVRR